MNLDRLKYEFNIDTLHKRHIAPFIKQTTYFFNVEGNLGTKYKYNLQVAILDFEQECEKAGEDPRVSLKVTTINCMSNNPDNTHLYLRADVTLFSCNLFLSLIRFPYVFFALPLHCLSLSFLLIVVLFIIFRFSISLPFFFEIFFSVFLSFIFSFSAPFLFSASFSLSASFSFSASFSLSFSVPFSFSVSFSFLVSFFSFSFSVVSFFFSIL